MADTFAIKCKRALQYTGMQRLVIAGGVSANRTLRDRLSQLAQKEGFKIFYPRPAFCTDNGAMIAFAGSLRLDAGQTQQPEFGARPRWPIDELTPA